VGSGRRLIITLLTSVLQQPEQWFGATTSERHGLQLLESGRPDLLFVTDPLEAGSGIALVRQAKQLHPGLPALVLLENDSPDNVRAALEAGCDGICVERRVGLGHLVAATRAVLGGGAYLDGPIVELMQHTSRGQVNGTLTPLTPREVQVLDCLVQGLSNAEIAAALYLSVETVRSHMKGIQRKLRARDRTHAAVIGLRLGLVQWD
jgi:DNA-binding NarL/FixJ family response regulator